MKNERIIAFEVMRRTDKHPLHQTGGFTVKIKNFGQEGFLKQ